MPAIYDEFAFQEDFKDHFCPGSRIQEILEKEIKARMETNDAED